jgi:hypothetical protein
MGIFGTLRNAVKNACLAGVQDALAELTAAPAEEPASVVLRLAYDPNASAGDEPARPAKAARNNVKSA